MRGRQGARLHRGQDLRLRRAAGGAGRDPRRRARRHRRAVPRRAERARRCSIVVAYLKTGKKPDEKLVAADADRHHQGQSRQGRAAQRGEVVRRPRPPAPPGDARPSPPGKRPPTRRPSACLCSACAGDRPSAFPACRRSTTSLRRSAAARSMALLGENGAGKSTLLKILSGVLPPDAGASSSTARRSTLATPAGCQALGIVTIYQEFNLDPDADGGREHLHRPRADAGSGFVDWRRMDAAPREHHRAASASTIDPRPARRATVGGRAAAGRDRPRAVDGGRLIIMDEPTSALTETEVAAAASHHRAALQGAAASRSCSSPTGWRRSRRSATA